MDTRKILLILLIGLGLLLAGMSFRIYRNTTLLRGCADCSAHMTLIGNPYDGWQALTWSCGNLQSNTAFAARCMTTHTNLEASAEDIILSEIRVPSFRIAETVLFSKNIEAYVLLQEGPAPDFAVTDEGRVYSKGGYLG